MLPRGTRYHHTPLCFAGVVRAERAARRRDWLNDALRSTRDAELVLIDPDNGLAPGSLAEGAADFPKYALFDDLTCFLRRGQSVVLYQHARRNVGGYTFDQQLRDQAGELRAHLGTDAVYTVRYRRGSARAYFIVPSPAHASLLRRRIAAFASTLWVSNGLFDRPVVYERSQARQSPVLE